MWLLGAAFVILVWELSKKAWDHARADRQTGRHASVTKAQEKAAPKTLTPARRRAVTASSDISWWASEILRGFPVHRAGWQNGWQAHQTARAQQQAQREESRTSHLEAQASIAEGMAEHRDRQQAAQQRIEDVRQPPADELAGRRAAKTDPPLPADSVQPRLVEGNGHVATATEGSYTGTVQTARSQAVLADETATDIGAQRQAAQQILEEMEAAGVDAASISAQADLVARLLAAENALHSVTDSGESVGSGVQQRHGGLKEAVDDAPVEPAEIGWYKD